jgi:hypothetical protein
LQASQADRPQDASMTWQIRMTAKVRKRNCNSQG